MNELLDLLIVGGGPAGTAAAFRAKELGLKALVIDYDDLMKRIRDYSKGKQILPSFGGGDKMQFPSGGALVSSLHFSPIDKDEMCTEWKALYKNNHILSQTGVELTGLESLADGTYRVLCYDHVNRGSLKILAKHVVIAIGRGVPRRFDIPGNADGIAYRLADAAHYIGRPACVIGGGTSAAEAVIAISNAKVDAKDSTSVCWFYRGDRMPRVSKALSDVFFKAYLLNGNIRYYPKSEPSMILTGDDGTEYLTMRVDRRIIEGRPNETTHLEFPKEDCIACIGEDIPESLLNSIGIQMITGGQKKKKRMVVTPLLETQQPNVYLVGDLLSQAYFETEDFSADPSGFKEVKHAGNVKASLRDGVLVAQVIQQKLAGKKTIDTAVTGEIEVKEDVLSFVTPGAIQSAAPPKESMDPSRLVSDAGALLIHVLPGNVTEAEYPVPKNTVTTIGRKGCDINFQNDNTLSEHAASISHGNEGYFLRDDGNPSGVFLKLPEGSKFPVNSGDLLQIGYQFLLLSKSGTGNFITHYDHTGAQIGRYQLDKKNLILGRVSSDIALNAEDMTLSRRHLALFIEGEKIFVRDLKSINGSFLKIQNTLKIKPGTQFKVGQQSFIFGLQEDAGLDPGHTMEKPLPLPSFVPRKKAAPVSLKSEPLEAPEPTKRPAEVKAEPSEVSKAPEDGPPQLCVTFKGLGKTVTLKAGQTICEAAEENGIDFNAECHAGVCGSDPIRILKGRENVSSEIDDQESETLEDMCELKPGEYRLACMTQINGPVEVEIVTQ